MALFGIKRSEDNEMYRTGHMEGYLTPKGEYGVESEASLFGSRKAAIDALKKR